MKTYVLVKIIMSCKRFTGFCVEDDDIDSVCSHIRIEMHLYTLIRGTFHSHTIVEVSLNCFVEIHELGQFATSSGTGAT